MLRFRLAVTATALAALALAPTAAQAKVTSSTITFWHSSLSGTPDNNPYLLYSDNAPQPTLTVSGTATVMSPADTVDIDCFDSSPPKVMTLVANVSLTSGGKFTATAPASAFKKIAGHACRLRALPATSTHEGPTFTGPQIAVSESEAESIGGSGSNAGKPFNFYLNGLTFTDSRAYSAPGTPSHNVASPPFCGGTNISPIDSSLSFGNPAIDCEGALMSDDAGASGGRSEVQVDGRNAYDAAAAQALFSIPVPSQSLAGFPATATSANWDPTTGLVSSTSKEQWVACNGPNVEAPTYPTCPSFTPLGVQLQRDLSASDDGHVVTMTDTWSSTDHAPHTLDLLYDDTVGLFNNGSQRGYQFPGESGFAAHAGGDRVAGPTTAPGSIFVRTNLAAADGDPSEAIGAITFSRAPSGFGFVSGREFVEHHALQVPADATVSLSYVYSTGTSVASVTALALGAQDRLQPLAVAVTSPASGTIVSTPVVTVTGTATAGSGISSLVVGGQTVPVGARGAWSANIPLNPGSNPIDVLATDGAGATAHGQLTVVYQPPAPPPARVVWCQVPRTKGMKLAGARRALRHAHCRPGRVKHVRSHKVRRGRVMSTRPPAGRQLQEGAKVELFVSRGHA